jgi:hypothetical protein
MYRPSVLIIKDNQVHPTKREAQMVGKVHFVSTKSISAAQQLLTRAQEAGNDFAAIVVSGSLTQNLSEIISLVEEIRQRNKFAGIILAISATPAGKQALLEAGCSTVVACQEDLPDVLLKALGITSTS